MCLWSETFDKERDTNDDGVIDPLEKLPEPGDQPNGVVVGRSGNGWRPSKEFPFLIPPNILTRGSTLVRGSRSDGFYLACSVFLPAMANSSHNIPLLLIGDDKSPVNGQCQLAFKRYFVTIHSNPIASLGVWDLVGDINGGVKKGGVTVSSIDNAIADRLGVEALPSGEKDVSRPIVAGRWHDVGLLYDGERMILYCDGERIAQRFVGAQSQLVKTDNSIIYLGSMPKEEASDPPTIYADAPLDDARLYRLGTADLGELPGNVVLLSNEGARPDGDLKYRILCQPDGRVEVSRDSSGTSLSAPLSTTITIGQLRTPSALQAAEITIMLDGRVTSRLLTHAPTSQAGMPK